MTIEQKAKTYDEALERAKEMCAMPTDKATMEYIFPELAESEDERIKEDLIQWIDDFPDTIWRGHYKKDILSWLEKQGEQKPIINIPSRELILSIWDLGNEWKDLTKGCCSTEHGTQLNYIQKHWHESEYYLKEKQEEIHREY